MKQYDDFSLNRKIPRSAPSSRHSESSCSFFQLLVLSEELTSRSQRVSNNTEEIGTSQQHQPLVLVISNEEDHCWEAKELYQIATPFSTYTTFTGGLGMPLVDWLLLCEYTVATNMSPLSPGLAQRVVQVDFRFSNFLRFSE
jgi:hypothetical protein